MRGDPRFGILRRPRQAAGATRTGDVMSNRHAAMLAAVVLLCVPAVAAASCGSAFCMVNTNWGVQGLWNEPGVRADFRFEFIDQDQPRAGTRGVGVGEVSRHHDEVRTINRNVFATFDYGFSDALGVSLVVPWVDRQHEHIHNHRGEALRDAWSFAGPGDVRLLSRYQFPGSSDPLARRAGFAGVTAGLKLPTGRTNVANGEGEAAERSLQPGTGTTDAIVGAYYREALADLNASWFVQATVQRPFGAHRDFRPGWQALFDIGLRVDAIDRLGVLLQLNALHKARDSGAEAEPDDSGSRTVAFSPGVTYALTPRVSLYAFVQIPVYQRVNGVQLTADRSYAVGVSAQF
jgi:hypothetical protein